MKIYVGNLSYDATDADLKEVFEKFGTVDTVTIVKDKFSGESRGFGFVEMANQNEGMAAIEGLNGQSLKGRDLKVNEARPRPEGGNRRQGGFGGRGGFGGPRREGGFGGRGRGR